MKIFRSVAFVIAISLLGGAASCIRYTPRPVTAALVLDDFESRRLDSSEFGAFLQKSQGWPWPLPSWNLESLTLAALYYHPDLDVARASWTTALAARITAGERPNPTLSLLAGYNSTTPAAEITPWIPETSLEIPIETAGKRGYRVAEARELSESARLNILSTAWEVRSRLRGAFLDDYSARETAALLERQRALQEENVRILEAQLAIGEAAVPDVTQARLALASSRLAAFDAAKQSAQARIQLAAAVGVPLQAIEGVTLSFDGLLDARPDIPSREIRRRALTSRTDILAALSDFAAADAALRLELAKQYPDLSLGPNFQLDQTDAKWTLGLSFVLPILNRNRGPIAEAEAKRTEASARFLALQAKVIAEIDGAVASCRPAAEKAKAADDLLANLKRQEASAKARYDLGEISKLEFLGLEIEAVSSELARLDALVKCRQAVGELEDAMGIPIEGKDWLLKSPDRAAGPVKERKHD